MNFAFSLSFDLKPKTGQEIIEVVKSITNKSFLIKYTTVLKVDITKGVVIGRAHDLIIQVDGDTIIFPDRTYSRITVANFDWDKDQYIQPNISSVKNFIDELKQKLTKI